MTELTQSERSTTTTRSAHGRGWIVLVIAGVFEIGYAVSTGGSKGFTDLNWSIAAVAFFFLTVFTLSLALKTIDVGIGYAVWAGIGASGAAVVSSFVFDQALTPVRIFWLLVIIGGVIGVKIASDPKWAESSRQAAHS